MANIAQNMFKINFKVWAVRLHMKRTTSWHRRQLGLNMNNQHKFEQPTPLTQVCVAWNPCPYYLLCTYSWEPALCCNSSGPHNVWHSFTKLLPLNLVNCSSAVWVGQCLQWAISDNLHENSCSTWPCNAKWIVMRAMQFWHVYISDVLERLISGTYSTSQWIKG